MFELHPLFHQCISAGNETAPVTVQSNFWVFYLKKFGRETDFCFFFIVGSVGQVWWELHVQMLCFFVPLLLLQCIIVLHTCCACVSFFSCVVTVFFGLTIAKLVLCIFSCSKMCILHPFWICIVQDCLFVYPVAFLHFGIVCILTGLPYFL